MSQDETRTTPEQPSACGEDHDRWFGKGLSLGMKGARLIAKDMGADNVADAIQREHDKMFPPPTVAGEAEYQSWMIELEMQSWERAA